jgi:hypothetical protein
MKIDKDNNKLIQKDCKIIAIEEKDDESGVLSKD